ncbi:helix-turn-helix domain-containing protein [Streptomyces sp. SID9727]|uniref:MarR family transcriptional regulator n=1 Tax=Streptomyces sp. SID9727 TaxID=2706114 RepID=UPI0013C7C9EB|nr:helix-turn-helix domain-containing protein [Streptomyces sp. SID9727]NEC63524.1 MarR family transcriptional regulator [Streptomyces sp. SID9727]
MTPVQLFLLGRTLMKIGEQALPEPSAPAGAVQRGGTRAALVVLSDVLGHQDTSVSEIAARTGLPQSQVSGAVARLKETGSFVSAPDPADGRRQLIRTATEVSERVAEVRSARIDDALSAALGTDDPETMRRIGAALDVLALHLTPEAAADPRT